MYYQQYIILTNYIYAFVISHSAVGVVHIIAHTLILQETIEQSYDACRESSQRSPLGDHSTKLFGRQQNATAAACLSFSI